MPGHGFSEGKPCISIEESAEWISDLFKELNLNEIVYLGHSQGCLTGLELNNTIYNSIKQLSNNNINIESSGIKGQVQIIWN